MIPIFVAFGLQAFANKQKPSHARSITLSTTPDTRDLLKTFRSRFNGGPNALNFCAGPEGSGQNGASTGKRPKRRRQQIKRLGEKYVPDGRFTIMKRGAIQGARTMDNPWEVETLHYKVKTDISRKAAGEIALLMELLYDSLLRSNLFPDQNDDFERISVVVPKNRTEFTEIAPGSHMSSDRGSFSPGPEDASVYAYYFNGDKRQLVNVLLYQGTRQFLNMVTHESVPQWLDEGLSRVFEYSSFRNMQLVPGQVSVRYKREVVEALQWEGRGSYDYLEPFPALLRMDETFLSDNEAAQMWGVVHFLINWKGGKLSNPLSKHLNHFRTEKEIKRDPVQLFQKHFGFHPEKLRNPWETYILKL